MNEPQFDELEYLKPRDYWSNEAIDFTPWLAKHLDLLGETLGLDFESSETESSVGDFSADIVATVSGRDVKVVIENQLEETDHSHLGQLLTYASGHDAGILIWLTPEFRNEHLQALDWLNQHTDESLEFYGVTINLIKIGDSRPALEFRPAMFPKASQRKARSRRTPLKRSQKVRDFFKELISELGEKHPEHPFAKSVVDRTRHWHVFDSGFDGIGYHISFYSHTKVRVELFISRDDAAFNERLSTRLEECKGKIRSKLGVEDTEELRWSDHGKANKMIALYREGSIQSSNDELAELRAWMINTLIKFKEVFTPHLAELVPQIKPD